MNRLLKAIELPYRGLNRIRRALYRAGVLQSRRLPKPVISIGNIAAGGAGKTPAVIALAKFLVDRGHRVAVLTRGYGRKGEGGRVDTPDAARYGDEPVVIKKRLPNVDVIVGRNRYDNALTIDADVFLLDDGFQHLQLHRDLDIVIDVPGPAFLREGRSALRDADFVVPRRIHPSGLETLRGKRVFAFSGLADNEQFFGMLRSAGLHLAGTRGFPDHHRYSESELQQIRAVAADVIVTTEKDAVKIGDPSMIAIPIEFEFDHQVLERVASLVT